MARTKKQIMANVDHTKARIIGNNTIEYYRSDGTRVVRLHLTDIAEFLPGGDIRLNTDGWRTVTTKARLNEHVSGCHIYQESSIWYVIWGSGQAHVFEDGMILHPDATVTGAGPNPKKLKKLNRQISAYVKGYMSSLYKGEVPAPSQGDCWFCSMKTVEDDRPLGDSINNGDHLLSHIEEKYYVPSLLWNAIQEIPVSQVAQQHLASYWQDGVETCESFAGVAKEQLSKALRRYMKMHLGLAR